MSSILQKKNLGNQSLKVLKNIGNLCGVSFDLLKLIFEEYILTEHF